MPLLLVQHFLNALALAHETSAVFDPSAAILLHRLRAFSRLLEVVRNHDEGPA